MLSGPWAADLLGDQGADVIKGDRPAPVSTSGFGVIAWVQRNTR